MSDTPKRRGRPPSPGGPKSGATRQAALRDRVAESGGRMLPEIPLTQEAAQALQVLIQRHGGQQEAVNAALIAAASAA